MVRFFLACAVFGGVILLAQIILGLFGVNDHDTTTETELDHDHGIHHHGEGLNLFSVRALSSGVAFFDQKAVRAVTVSDPLVRLPEDYRNDWVGVHFGFEYTDL